jgi:hypothetical protein
MVAAISDLDELCIDVDMLDLADADRLHAFVRAIRCHAYRPTSTEKARRARLGWDEELAEARKSGLIDTLCCDDIGWLIGSARGPACRRRGCRADRSRGLRAAASGTG